MKRFLTAVTLAVTTLLAVATPATAAPPQQDSGVVDASKRVAGFTAGQLLGEEWRQLIELPPDANPIFGNGNNCLSAGHKDKVLILWTTPPSTPPAPPAPPAVCDVKPGTPVFFSTIGGECSSAEPDPYHGETEEQQRQCILDNLAPFDAILVRIDGGPPVNVGLDSFLAVSGQGTVYVPDPNIFGPQVPGNRQATFVAAGYSVLLRPLRPGTHTITVTIIGGPYAGIINRAVVNVVPSLKS